MQRQQEYGRGRDPRAWAQARGQRNRDMDGEHIPHRPAYVAVNPPPASRTVWTIVENWSSSRIRSAASRATSPPRQPIAMPISARFRAGASFTPSPVMRDDFSVFLQRFYNPHFVPGATREKDGGCADCTAKLFVAHRIQLVARNGAPALRIPTFPVRAASSRHIARYHDNANACPLQRFNILTHAS